MSSQPIGGMLAPWTAQDEKRHQWMLEHFRTCAACDLYPRDGEGTMCSTLTDVLNETALVATP